MHASLLDSASRPWLLRGDTHSGLARVRHQVWLIRKMLRALGMIFGPPESLVRASGHFGSEQVIRIRGIRQQEFCVDRVSQTPRFERCSREEGKDSASVDFPLRSSAASAALCVGPYNAPEPHSYVA